MNGKANGNLLVSLDVSSPQCKNLNSVRLNVVVLKTYFCDRGFILLSKIFKVKLCWVLVQYWLSYFDDKLAKTEITHMLENFLVVRDGHNIRHVSETRWECYLQTSTKKLLDFRIHF